MKPEGPFYFDNRPGNRCWRVKGIGCDMMFGPTLRSQPARGETWATCSLAGEWRRVRLPSGRLSRWRLFTRGGV